MDLFLNYQKVYSDIQESLIAEEFNRLKGNYYLDHAGSTLYSENQIRNVLSDLSNNIYSNPHARNIISKSTEDAIDIVRYEILEHFNTNSEEYSIIFTSGATAALKIIAECFYYGEDNVGACTYLENNHTSVLGMRSFAKNTVEIKTEAALKVLSTVSNKQLAENDKEICHNGNNLFVYPAQCNFSGTKYPLSWIENIKNGHLNYLVENKSKNWYVVVDCASFVSTNTLDLSKYKPDFIPISFYKVFGYPTGLGALLVKKSSEGLLRKKYLGGGTVLMVLSSKNIMIPKTNLKERFEDGTLPFLSILAVRHGFDTINRLNINFDLISQHTFSLAQYVYRNLLVLHHFNGYPAAILYHDTTFERREHQGGIINFNLLTANGDFIGYSEVLNISNLHGIHLRTGCFCNPGACQRFLKLSPNDVLKHFEAGHVCGDQHDLVNSYPTGSVRISFGYMSTIEDARKFLNMIETCFVSKPIVKKFPTHWNEIQDNYEKLFSNIPVKQIVSRSKHVIHNEFVEKYVKDDYTEDVMKAENVIGTLRQILIYPIKSCGAFSASNNWPITYTGLKYDREWMITNPAGICLTQKHNKKLCLIKPEIDLKKEFLRLRFKGQSDIEISLDIPTNKEKQAYLCQSKVCGDRIQGWDCGNEVSNWLSTNLRVPGLRLLRQCHTSGDIGLGRISNKDTTPQLSLTNKAQFLLINSASVEWLIQKIPADEMCEDINSIIQRFRPNFVVDFEYAFQENEFEVFRFNNILFKSAGKCTRCQMICINQDTGEISKEPLRTLSREFKSKVSFGIYLNQNISNEEIIVSVGDNVVGNNNSP